ncbi:MAG: hypothetical protein NTZ93_04440 [Candidatus Beckwithbacteria bacterium]|nr:hypothetical protein [Candidatus Beckwithbacteria bacterium]
MTQIEKEQWQDQLSDDRMLYWYKVPSETGLVSYWINLIKRGQSKESVPSLLLSVDEKTRTIISLVLTSQDKNIVLGFDGVGDPTHVSIMTDSRIFNLSYNLLTGGVDYRMPNVGYYLTDETNGHVIRDVEGNNYCLGLEWLSDQTMMTGSDSWKDEYLKIVIKPLSMDQLLVFSPHNWGKSDKAESVVRIMERVMSERIIPVAV